MTREQQDAVIDALDRADTKMHQAVAEFHGKLVEIERERREAIMRALAPAGGEPAST